MACRFRLGLCLLLAGFIPACGSTKTTKVNVPVPVPVKVTITSIVANPASALPGADVTLTATATTTGSGTLTYTWSAAAGILSSPTGNPVTWTAPGIVGTYIVNLTVSDGNGASTSDVTTVLVSNGPPWAVCSESHVQEMPAIVTDGQGGAIIAWYDYRNGSAEVYAQRIAGDGVCLWTLDGVFVGSSIPYYIELVSDGAGGALFVWNGADGALRVQRLNDVGTPLWTAGGIAIGPAGQNEAISDGAGGVVIASTVGAVGKGDVFAQRVDSSGSVLWTPGGVSLTGASGDQSNIRLVTDGGGGAIIVWHDSRNGVDQDVYGQRITVAGALAWAPDGVAICSAASPQAYPELVSDGMGGAIVAWTDLRAGIQMYAQRIDGSGVLQWAPDGVLLATSALADKFGRLAPDGTGGAIVVWQRVVAGSDTDIFGQQITAAGVIQWGASGIAICVSPGTQEDQQIVSDSQGGCIVIWDDRNTGNVHAQRLNGSGALQWNPAGLPMGIPDQSKHGQLTADGTGGAVIVWENWGPLGVDIRARGVDTQGNLK